MKKLIAVLALALAACTTVSGPKEVGRFTNPANDKEYIALYNEQGE
jgi:starvation-inducible outer membrane lipoprotein